MPRRGICGGDERLNNVCGYFHGLDEDAKPKTVIRTLLGVDEDADIEVRASNVEVMGNEGSVLIEFYKDGVRVGQEGGDEPWVFADGQWYS